MADQTNGKKSAVVFFFFIIFLKILTIDNHGIELEGTFYGHLVQLSAVNRDTHSSSRCSYPVQLTLSLSKDGSSTTSSCVH